METSNVAASPRTVNSGVVNKLVFRVNQTARENSGGPRQFRLPVVVVQWRQSVVPPPSVALYTMELVTSRDGWRPITACAESDRQTDRYTNKLLPQTTLLLLLYGD
jgi:hypothetical protein